MNIEDYIKSKVRTIPDWPIKGVQYRDITTLLKDGEAIQKITNHLVRRYKTIDIDMVVGIESRGFIFGAIMAENLKVGFVPIRKLNKLPAETIMEEYKLEYGSAKAEIHKDALKRGMKVLLIDDLIATGGTALAACRLINKLGAKVVELSVLIDLPDLRGRAKVEAEGFKVHSIAQYP